MGQPSVDLPDPFDRLERIPPALSDELLSRLAGDQVNRLLADSLADEASAPVEQLTEQLDTFFEELREREIEPKAADFEDPEQFRIDPEELAALEEADDLPPRRALFARDEPDLRAYEPGKTLDFFARPIDSLSPAARWAMSATAIVSFIAACAALGYVLILRQG